MRTALTTFFLLSCLFASSIAAQEICDNGIDDDNDGLIDLNDTTDCNCPLISVVESLFPNPSFDEFDPGIGCGSNQTNGAPDGPGQADCIAGWQQASLSTTDAWHLLTYNGNPPFWPQSIPQPIPSGLAVAGLFTGVLNFDGYREYLGSCLPDGPLEAGTEYRLNFQLGFAEPTEDTDLNYLIESPPTEEFALYGILDCDNVPFDGNGCPELSGAVGWELITTFTASGPVPGWANIEVDFTPTQPYAALAFGGTCAPDDFPTGFDLYRTYYFVDDILLNTTEAFETTVTVGSISIFGDDICADDATMTVQDFAGATYQWYRNGVAIVGATGQEYYPALDDNFPGFYSCRITLPQGCGVAGPVELIRPVVTNAFQDSVFLCPNFFTTIVPNVSGTTVQAYLWDDGSTEPERVVDQAGTYSVTVTSFCEQTVETIVVTDAVEPTAELILEPSVFCFGDTVTAYISTVWQVDAFVTGQPYFNFIQVGDTVEFILTTSSNIFFFLNGQGCFPDQQEDILITVGDLDFDVGVDELSCEISEVEAAIGFLPGGADSYTYIWRDAAGNELSTEQTLAVFQAGDYSVEVTPNNSSCSFIEDFTVGFNDTDVLVTDAEVPELSCFDNNSTLSVTLADPTNTGLRWRFGGVDLATSSATIEVSDPGTYQLFAFVLDGMGDTLCLQEYSYEVTFNSADLLVTDAEVPVLSCVENSATLSVTLSDPDNTELRWRFGGADLATSLANITVTEAGTYQLFAFVLDGVGDTLCLQEYNYAVDFEQASVPVTVQTVTLDVCDGTSAAVLNRPTGFADWTVIWQRDGDSNPLVTGIDSVPDLAPGDYVLIFQNPNGSCEERRNFTVSLPADISLTAEVAVPDCPTPANPTVLSQIIATAANGTPPYDFQMTGVLNETNQTGVFPDLGDGNYEVSVTDANGCVAAAPVQLSVSNPGILSIEVGDDQQVRLGEGVRLTVQTAGAAVDSIIWSPVAGLSCTDCFSPTAAPVVNTIYTVTVISQDGCVETDELRILVDETANVYIPNAFSPNLDGVNDLFQFFPDQSFQELIDFRIYDRWGGEVFVADPAASGPIGWDGNAFDGKPFDTGVYTYFINVRLLNGREKQFSGTVTLLR